MRNNHKRTEFIAQSCFKPLAEKDWVEQPNRLARDKHGNAYYVFDEDNIKRYLYENGEIDRRSTVDERNVNTEARFLNDTVLYQPVTNVPHFVIETQIDLITAELVRDTNGHEVGLNFSNLGVIALLD